MLLEFKLSIILLKIDRWLLNHIFNRSRIFTIALYDCVDEFGNSFGKNGNHFFIRALKNQDDFNSMSSYLIDYYSNNRIRSFNEEIGHDIGSIEGNQYFCPWEYNRIRPLDKFMFSHKIGPTDIKAIPLIVTRLLNVLNSIKNNNIPPWRLLDGYPRVIKIINKNNKVRFLVRDGNHRFSVFSYLGIESAQVCFEKDHWTPSKVFLWIYKFIKQQEYPSTHNYIRAISEKDVDSWPHVKSGLVQHDNALHFFNSRFGNNF